MAKTSTSSGKKKTIIIFGSFFMLIGLLLMFLPTITSIDDKRDLENQVTAFKELVSSYVTVPAATAPMSESLQTETTPALPSVHSELYQDMLKYNQEILANAQAGLQDSDDFEATLIDPADYGISDGIVGLVSLPKIDIELPLYLGGNRDNLAQGFAQLGYTSMPIGGTDTNCVIAGHRGWRGMAYMRDVEELDLGDSIFVRTLWETLEYRISEIHLIEPWELEHIYIKEGRDLLTIVTCHPYGVGSHRYILVCDRYIPEPSPEETIPDAIGTTLPPTVELEWEWVDRVNISTGEENPISYSKAIIFLTECAPWICLAIAAIICLGCIVAKRRSK